MGGTIKLTAKDGVTISAYQASPAGRAKGAMVEALDLFAEHLR